MVETAKKVNFYRLALERGKRYRMELTEDYRLTSEGGGYSAYLASGFDSMDEGGTWHRLRLSGDFSGCKYEIIAAATDADLYEELMEQELSPEEQLRILKEFSWVRRVNTDDLLLHSLQGRYLWVFIGVSGSRIDSRFSIDGFQVEFPQGSFVEYLPEIYQESGRDSFFERYMTVLQSLYEDLEGKVDQIPGLLDYETAPDESMHMFADWTGGWAAEGEFTPEQLRFLIRRLQSFQSGKGTKRVMEEMIRLLTGREAMVVEYFKWHDWMKRGAVLLEEYEQLFGKNEDTFTVIIDGKDAQERISRERLSRLLKEYTPFGMHCNVVILDWSSHMDTHCYLDQNGCLSTPVPADAGGLLLGGSSILG